MVNVGKNTFWSAIGLVFGKGSLLLLIVFVSKLTSSSEFAAFNIFLLSMNVFSGVIGGAMNLTANRYGGELAQIKNLLLQILFSALIAGVLYVFYDHFFIDHDTSDLLVVSLSAIIICGMTIFTALNGLYYSRGLFKEYAFISGLYALLLVILCSLGGLLFKLAGIYLGFALTTFLCSVIPVSIFLRKIKVHCSIDFSEMKRTSKNVLVPAIVSGALYQPAVLISALLVERYAGVEEVIAYTVANQFRMILSFLPIMLGSVLMKLLVDDLAKESLHVEHYNYSLSYYPMLLIVVVLSGCNELILSFFNNLDGEHFRVNLCIMLSAAVISSFKSAVARKFVTRESGAISILSNFSWFLIYILLCYFLIPEFGSQGAVVSFLLSHLLHVLIWSPFYYKHRYYFLPFFDTLFFGSTFLFILIILCVYFNILLLAGVFFIGLLPLLYLELKKLKKLANINNLDR